MLEKMGRKILPECSSAPMYTYISPKLKKDINAEIRPVSVPSAAEPKNILRKYPSACRKVCHPLTSDIFSLVKPSAVLDTIKREIKRNGSKNIKHLLSITTKKTPISLLLPLLKGFYCDIYNKRNVKSC